MSLHLNLFEQMDVVLECKDERAEVTVHVTRKKDPWSLDKILVLRSFDHAPYCTRFNSRGLHARLNNSPEACANYGRSHGRLCYLY